MNKKQNLFFTGYIKKINRRKRGFHLALSKGIFWKPEKGRQIVAGGRKYLIKTAVLSNKDCFISLEGVEDLTELFNMVGVEVFALEEDFYKKSFSRESLVGIKVETDSGRSLGNVTDFYKTGANDILEIQGDREYLVPFTDVFIEKIDIEGRIIVVKEMDGLLE